MSAIFENESLGPTERLIMLALADHADDTGRCYPSIQRLCQRTGLGERAVQINIRKLVDAGYLSILIGGGKSNSNVYFVSANPAVNAPYAAGKQTPHEMHPAPDAPQTPHLVRSNPAPDAPEPSGTIIEPSVLAEMGKKRRKPEHEIPPDWVPSDRNIADAQARQFSEMEIANEADRFRNHHISKGSRFRDWDAAWRTWLGNARRFAGGGMAGKAATGGRGQGRSLASIVAQRRLGD